MDQYAIPLAALIMSVVTLLMTGLSLRSSAGRESSKELRERLKECEAKCETLTDENITLWRRLMRSPDQ